MTTPVLVLHNTIRCTKSVAFILMLSLTTHTYDLWVRVAPIAEVRPTAALLLSGKKKKGLEQRESLGAHSQHYHKTGIRLCGETRTTLPVDQAARGSPE